jgi:two-component system cell cycle response regulator
VSARVLIVEDNVANLELMTYLLSAFGHSVLTAESGIEGLQAAARDVPDLIICDMQLPDIDGFEVARRLRRDARLASIPLVAVTALAMVGDRDRVLAAGFDGYLPKPIDPETFVPEIQAYLPSAQAAPAPESAAAELPGSPARIESGSAILVVDNLPVNLDLARGILSPSGYRVVTAANMADGLALARNQGCDLILSDVCMPVGSGYDFVQQVRSDPQLRDIPFILITSTFLDDRDRDRALSLGATRFLRRPIEPQDLLAEIAACLKQETGAPWL